MQNIKVWKQTIWVWQSSPPKHRALTWQGSVIENRFQRVYEFKCVTSWNTTTREYSGNAEKDLLHFIKFKFLTAIKIHLIDIVKLWRSSVEEWLIWTFRRDKITVAFIKRFGIRLLYRLSTGYLIVLFIIDNWSLRWRVSASATQASLVQTKTYGEARNENIMSGSSSVTNMGVTFYLYAF